MDFDRDLDVYLAPETDLVFETLRFFTWDLVLDLLLEDFYVFLGVFDFLTFDLRWDYNGSM